MIVLTMLCFVQKVLNILVKTDCLFFIQISPSSQPISNACSSLVQMNITLNELLL